MAGIDRWERSPAALPPGTTFVIERVAHGLTEDKSWRTRYNQDVAAGLPVGFYAVPETTNAGSQAAFVKGLVGAVAHQLGLWWDVAVGDMPFAPSTGFLDALRAGMDGGVYLNGSGLDLCPEYRRFERLWFAGSSPPARWLMWQTDGLNSGDDIDVAADLGGGVRAGWGGWSWPNL